MGRGLEEGAERPKSVEGIGKTAVYISALENPWKLR